MSSINNDSSSRYMTYYRPVRKLPNKRDAMLHVLRAPFPLTTDKVFTAFSTCSLGHVDDPAFMPPYNGRPSETMVSLMNSFRMKPGYIVWGGYLHVWVNILYWMRESRDLDFRHTVGAVSAVEELELFRSSPVQVGVLNIPNAKDPDEYIKKYGPERFRELLDRAGNALDFRLGRARAKYDLAQDNQRLEYIQEAVNILADGTTPTEKELYAGRLAEETNLSKNAILSQVEAAARRAGARRRSARQKELLHSGEMDTIKLPYGKDGPGALGAASAQRRLIAAALRQPEELARIAPALAPESILDEKLREAYQAILACWREGREVSVGALSNEIGEEAMNELCAVAAEYSDVGCTPQDIEMYLERIARGKPLSAQAGRMSGEELADYIARIREKKE